MGATTPSVHAGGVSPLDPFEVFPVRMLEGSHFLFDHCKFPTDMKDYWPPSAADHGSPVCQWSVVSRHRIPKNPNSLSYVTIPPPRFATTYVAMHPTKNTDLPSSVTLAIRDPALFHGALLLAGMHWHWLNGDVAVIQETYLYHKLEAIRLVNDQLADPNTSHSDSVIGTIACLALAEVSHFHQAHSHHCPPPPSLSVSGRRQCELRVSSV